MDKWEKLWQELHFLINQGVTSVHPQIVLEYMSFIDQLEVAEERNEKGDQQ